MAKILPFEYFEPVLEHSISNMKRIKKELGLAEEIESIDFIGFAILSTKNSSDDFIKTLSGVLRDSDVISLEKGFIYLFLPGTYFDGLMNIISDFREFYNDIFDYVASATLLKDLKNVNDILAELRKAASDKGWKI